MKSKQINKMNIGGVMDFLSNERPFLISQSEHTIVDTVIHIGDITSPEEYFEVLEAIENTTGSLHVKLNTDGGDLSTTIALYYAIKERELGSTLIEIVNKAYSGGSVLALATYGLKVNPMSQMMIHSPSSMDGGKHNEMKMSRQFSERQIEVFYKEVYSGFLTEEEIESVLADKDIWLNADEIAERFNKFVEYQMQQELLEEMDVSDDGGVVH